MATRSDTMVDRAPWEWLYSMVGAGMWATSRVRFRVEVDGPVPAVAPGQLWVVTHRAETDVPLLGAILMSRGGMWRRGAGGRVHFAARDDLFEPGVVAAGLHLRGPLGAAAWPMSVARWLPRVRAHPIRRPTGLKLAQALSGLDPATPLDRLLTPTWLEARREETESDGRPAPVRVGDLRAATDGALLWSDVTEADLADPDGAAVWRRHVARAAGDLRRLVRLVRSGEPMVVFPEGRLSPDGALGPVSDFLRVLVDHGRPESVIPVTLAYDPLTSRRPTAVFACAEPLAPSTKPMTDAVEAAWAHRFPLTVGQFMAHSLLDLAGSGETRTTRRALLEGLAQAEAVARSSGRATARATRSPGRRAEHVDRSLELLAKRDLVRTDGVTIELDSSEIRCDPLLARLAREYRSGAGA